MKKPSQLLERSMKKSPAVRIFAALLCLLMLVTMAPPARVSAGGEGAVYHKVDQPRPGRTYVLMAESIGTNLSYDNRADRLLRAALDSGNLQETAITQTTDFTRIDEDTISVNTDGYEFEVIQADAVDEGNQGYYLKLKTGLTRNLYLAVKQKIAYFMKSTGAELEGRPLAGWAVPSRPYVYLSETPSVWYWKEVEPRVPTPDDPIYGYELNESHFYTRYTTNLNALGELRAVDSGNKLYITQGEDNEYYWIQFRTGNTYEDKDVFDGTFYFSHPHEAPPLGANIALPLIGVNPSNQAKGSLEFRDFAEVCANAYYLYSGKTTPMTSLALMYPDHHINYVSEALQWAPLKLYERQHDMVPFPAKEPTCTESGRVESYWCKTCREYYADVNESRRLTDSERYLPPLGHSIVRMEETEATCAQEGLKAHWECERCGVCFADSGGNTEIDRDSITIEKKPHTLPPEDGDCLTELACTVCGYVEREKFDSHAYGTSYTNPEDGKHTSQCTHPGCVQTMTESCTSDTAATCLTLQVCKVCGKSFGEKNPENHEGTAQWQQGETTHKKVYDCCGAVAEPEAAHTWETGKCTTCGYVCQHTGGEASYFQKAVCEICRSEYGDLLVDGTAPQGEIRILEHTWSKLLNQITFGLFFKDTQRVEITASDDSYDHTGYTDANAVEIAYYLHQGDTALTEAELAEADFIPYEKGFNIAPDNKYVIYARITDHAGNVTYLSSDGIILDATAPTAPDVDTGSYTPGDWLTEGAVTITVSGSEALSGIGKYQYSTDNGASWKDMTITNGTASLVVSEETNGTNYLFRAVSRSGVEGVESAPVTVKIDKTAPEGEIRFEGKSVKTPISDVSFGLFYGADVPVEILARDAVSVISQIAYYRSDRILTEGEVEALTDWTPTEDGHFLIAAENETRFICYVRITDEAGNETYFASVGATFDLEKPVINGISQGKTYCQEQTFTVEETNPESVEIDGAAVTPDETGKYVLAADNKAHTITVTDKAGNRTLCTVTVNDGHTWMDTVYTWAEDGSSCTASRTCEYDPAHVETAEADVTMVSGRAPTCTEKGETIYTAAFTVAWAAEQSKTIADVPALGHQMTRTEEKAPTCTEDGNRKYWTCDTCGKHFYDAEGKAEMKPEDMVIKATGHGATELKNQKEATCTEEGYTGDKVCKDCGTVLEKGKAIGKIPHNYKDGKCTVCHAADPNEKPDPGSPQTGDNSNILLWTAMLVVSAGVLAMAVYGKQKKQKLF